MGTPAAASARKAALSSLRRRASWVQALIHAATQAEVVVDLHVVPGGVVAVLDRTRQDAGVAVHTTAAVHIDHGRKG